ncbi:MAG: hypothetical protein AB4040_11030 [Synechococcus sp.]
MSVKDLPSFVAEASALQLGYQHLDRVEFFSVLQVTPAIRG